MVCSSGVSVSAITAQGGEIKVAVQSWTARTMVPGQVIDQGVEVEVYEVDGAIAVVVKDAPPESIVTGVPAKWRHRDAQRETTPAVDPAEYDIEYRI